MEKRAFNTGRYIHDHRGALAILVVLVSLWSISYLPNIQFRSDFSKFFPERNSDLEFYQRHEDRFGNRNNLVSVGIVRSEGVIEQDFLKKVQAFSDSCRGLTLVQRTYSILSIPKAQNTPFGLLLAPLLDLSADSISARDRSAVFEHPLVRGQLLSEDGRALLLLLELEEERDMTASIELIDRLQALLDTQSFEEAHIIGTTILEINHVRLTAEEMSFFIRVCVGLIIFLLLLIYRSWVAMVLPLLVFLFSMIILGALLALLGISLDTMSTMLPAILLIVSISDVIHLFGKMQSLSKAELPLLIDSFNEVARTNLLTSVTTAFGFLTLVISPMPTLVDFGISVALGVFIAYLLSILIVPITFFAFPMRVPAPRGLFADEQWRQAWVKPMLVVLRRPRLVYAVLALLVVVALVGVAQVRIDRFMTSTMPYRHEIRSSYQFFENHFGGSREFELAIAAGEQGGLQHLENLQLLGRLERYLDSMQVVGGVFSPVSFFRLANRVFLKPRTTGYSLPETQGEVDRLVRRVPEQVSRRFRTVMDSSMTLGLLRGHMHDIGQVRHRAFMEEIDQWLARQDNPRQLEFRHTGIPYLLDTVSLLQVRANFIGLLIATVFISLLIALLFRRGFFILVVLVANLLPLLLIAGIMGFAGIELRGGTSLIFSVAFVIIVDDSIHFLSNFMHLMDRGLPKEQAIEAVLRHTGHPIFLTSLVLVSVTLILLWSSLPDVRNLGFLLSVSLVVALLFDLFVLPELLWTGYRAGTADGAGS